MTFSKDALAGVQGKVGERKWEIEQRGAIPGVQARGEGAQLPLGKHSVSLFSKEAKPIALKVVGNGLWTHNVVFKFQFLLMIHIFLLF